MTYTLSKKAYYVGDKDAIYRQRVHGFTLPDEWIDVVHAKTSGKAKYIFSQKEGVEFVDCHCIRAMAHDLYNKAMEERKQQSGKRDTR